MNSLIPFFAQVSISGSDLGTSLLVLFVVVLIGLIIWWLGKTFFPKLGMPAIGMQVWDGLFLLVAAFCVINFLASMVGHPLVKFR